MKRKHDNGFPSRDAIVAFIRANPGKIGTREIAREFGLKNADRVELKRTRRELADDFAHRRREDVDAADDEHVVGSADAADSRAGSAALARARLDLDVVTRAEA